jgi:hypothetical protein
MDGLTLKDLVERLFRNQVLELSLQCCPGRIRWSGPADSLESETVHGFAVNGFDVHLLREKKQEGQVVEQGGQEAQLVGCPDFQDEGPAVRLCFAQ